MSEQRREFRVVFRRMNGRVIPIRQFKQEVSADARRAGKAGMVVGAGLTAYGISEERATRKKVFSDLSTLRKNYRTFKTAVKAEHAELRSARVPKAERWAKRGKIAESVNDVAKITKTKFKNARLMLRGVRGLRNFGIGTMIVGAGLYGGGSLLDRGNK